MRHAAPRSRGRWVIARLRLPGGLALFGSGGRRRRFVVAAALLLLVAGVVRLAVAPLTVPLDGLAERWIAGPGNTAAEVRSVGLRVGFGGFRLVLSDVRLRTDEVTASIPRIVLSQGWAGRTILIDGAVLRVDPSSGGTAAAAGLAPPSPREALRALDAALVGARALLRERQVRAVEVTRGRVELVTPRRPISEARVFQDLDATLTTTPGLGVRLRTIGTEGPVSLVLGHSVGESGRRLVARVSGLAALDLASTEKVRGGFVVDALLLADFTPDGAVAGAELGVDVGAGTVVFGPDPPRVLDRASLSFALAPGEDAILVESADFVAGGTRVPVTGRILPASNPAAPWTFSLASSDALFDPADVEAGHPVAAVLDVEGRIDFRRRLVHVDRFSAAAPTGRADAVFTFDASDAGPLLSGAVRVSPTTVRTALKVWPPAFAYGPRMAVLSTVLGGVVERGDLDFALTPLELDGDPTTHDMIEGGLSVAVDFVDTTLTAPELPIAVQNARGALRIRDKELAARIDAGRISAGEAGSLSVDEGSLSIADLTSTPPTGTLRATVYGPVAAVVALAERLEVEEVRELDIQPSDVDGEVRAELWIETPLAENVPMRDRRWSIDALLTDVSSSVPIGGQAIDSANLEVLVNSRRLAARGRAVIDGLTVDVNYSELFAGGRSGAARFVLTDEERRRRGFDTGETVTGPVVVMVEAGDEEDRQLFRADLTDARIALPGFSKRAGETMSAQGAVVRDGDLMQIQDLVLEGAGARLSGALLVADGALDWAALDTFALSEVDEARMNVERPTPGAYRVDLEAERFDARRLLEAATEGGTGDGALPVLSLRARGKRVRLAEDAVAGDVALDLVYDGERLEQLSLSGRIDAVPGGTFAAKIVPSGDGNRLVQGDVRELGRLLSAFNIYERMEGGRATLEGRMRPDGRVVGRIVVRDFVLTDETTLEAVIARARQRDENNPRPLAFRGEQMEAGQPFDSLVIEFEKDGDVIRIRDAILRGPVMGGTGEGTIDLGRDDVSLTGTFIPAYGVNNLFGRLPLFGEILGGGQEGGLIGVTFRLQGPLEDPVLLLNPISAIAPGIFRRIFEFR